METFKDYERLIKSATSKEQLRDIVYRAFLADDDALKMKTTLYNKVVKACIKREDELEFGRTKSH